MVSRTRRPEVPVVHADEVEHRRQLAVKANAALSKDGTDGMTAPLKLAPFTQATVPDPTLWEGSLAYVDSSPAFSNGISWLHQTSYPINVMDYGAVGDGVTDDTQAFADAIAGIPSGWGVILVPPGTYLVTNITLTGGITLQGAGSGQAQNSSATVILGNDAADNAITVNGSSCSIRDLAVIGNLSPGTSTAAGIQLTVNEQNTSLERVLIQNFKYGVHVLQGVQNFSHVRVDSCSSHGFFFDAANGVGMGEYRLLYCNSNLNGGDGFNFSGGGTQGTVGIFFFSPTAASNAGNGYTFASGGPNGVTDIYLCQVVASTNTGNGIDAGSNTDGVNIIINDGLIEGTVGIGIAIGDTVYQVVLSGLNIDGYDTGIALTGNGGVLSDITFTNNTTNIELGAASNGYSLSNINGNNIQGGSSTGLIIDGGAGAFVATGVDLTYASTVYTGTIPAGSRLSACPGFQDIHPTYTVATLPTGVTGGVAFATNCRVFNGAGTLEGAGVGTGGLVTFNGTAWKVAGTNITASA